jgi:hypothetical protein
VKHAGAIAVVAAVAFALGACDRRGGAPAPAASAAASARPAPEPAASAASPAKSAASSAEAADTSQPFLAEAGRCRAIAVHGTVTAADGKPLTPNASLERTGVLTLLPDASVAVKHTETSRELVFSGKGRVLPCERGEERFLLNEGRARTTTWAGARPGAEVLVATPFGAIRYGDAKLDVRVDSRMLTVVSEIGDAWVLPALSSSEEKVPAGRRFEKRGPAPDVKALVAECEKRAEDAEARARAVLVPGSGAAPLGVRAAEHVRARSSARASCAIAAASILSLETAPEKAELGGRLASADARWRGIPSHTPQLGPAPKVESR